ncbi:peptidyl-prolyl cis-trans isomerase [Corynebacterium glutamicum MB001]|uniref:peptidylprolyl isomerase n=1 Tax=Corynebacterium glutamicum TaxID=1718 RepID=UPI0000165D75|nr:peptidylprolyl isomerase [Corynebacterium glutamicum]AGT05606.1 peptidyl-prolyl cis-trans isomerase [Corynebacterium glutamicum MB001]ARV64225.1 peptidyl-prolyl cis-trans isomerase [Corynebacterium glutamicum]ASW14256.1 peptidyl-prolyl cis-trans isomerase [Corynebacterium glutamicum]AUI01149.1 peptidylprolyl isomerase [Corynebacterium glutamicum]AUI04799.1 peptidylprolyl isomerase [Corynebacterium glutamicum]
MSTNKERRQQALSQLEKEIKSRDRKEKTKPLTVVFASLAVILVVVGGIWYAATRSTEDEVITADETSTTAETPDYQPLALTRTTALGDSVTCEYPDAGEASKDVSKPATENVPATGTVTVNLTTAQGNIGMELDRSVSPCTVNAVEHMASEGYYNDTVCHRITTSGIYVLQCGDPSSTGAGGPGFSFANEYPTDEATDLTTPVIYERGTIAMANAGADTNGSQFFLNYEDSPLAPNYTYFGQITEEGLATLDAIAEVGTEGGTGDGAPAQEVRIESAAVA